MVACEKKKRAIDVFHLRRELHFGDKKDVTFEMTAFHLEVGIA